MAHSVIYGLVMAAITLHVVAAFIIYPRSRIGDMTPQQELPNTRRCDHPSQIPGLDADYCRDCCTWWMDVEMRQRLLDKRR